MTITNRIARWGGARLSRRMARSLPWLGAVIAVATAASTIRRKGVISGTLDTGLNSVPFVGAAKNAVELMRGRDFFPDRFGPGLNRPRYQPRDPVTRRHPQPAADLQHRDSSRSGTDLE
ncbi:MAG: hypothetical protein ABI603_09435 [Acidobacteriota bacterium]